MSKKSTISMVSLIAGFLFLVSLFVATVIRSDVRNGNKGLSLVGGERVFKAKKEAKQVVVIEKGGVLGKSYEEIRVPSLETVRGELTVKEVIPDKSRVKKGDVLLKFYDNEVIGFLHKCEIELDELKLKLKKLEYDFELEKLRGAIEISKAEEEVRKAERNLKRYKEIESVISNRESELSLEEMKQTLQKSKEELKEAELLYKKGLISEKELDKATVSFKNNEKKLKLTEMEYKLLTKYTHPARLKTLEFDLESANIKLKETKSAVEKKLAGFNVDIRKNKLDISFKEKELEKVKKDVETIRNGVTAPVDGILYHKPSPTNWGSWRRTANEEIKEGVKFWQGEDIMHILVEGEGTVRFSIAEGYANFINEESKIKIYSDIFPDVAIEGKIIDIEKDKKKWQARSWGYWFEEEQKQIKYVEILDDKNISLKPGTKVRVEIRTDVEKIYVPKEAIFEKNGKMYCLVKNKNGVIEEKEISIGISTGEFVAVEGGIKENDEIVVREVKSK